MQIFLTRPIPANGVHLLEEAGLKVTTNNRAGSLSYNELLETCRQFDGLLVAGKSRIDRQFLLENRQLKVISLFSVGYDNVDIPTATELGIPVGNTPGILSGATADIAFLLLLAVSRKAFYNYKKILDGKWKEFEPLADLGTELTGKTLGIYGLGSIGFAMAEKCRAAYDMKIIYHNRNRNEKAERELDARYVSFDELLRDSDVISVHVNLTPETRGVFNKQAFSKMKTSAIFINTSRGAVHNESDLKDALENNVIWGAGLDVTNPEPMDKNNPLLLMPNVCVLPHIGSATTETREKMAVIAARNAIAGLNGERLLTIVNPEVYGQAEV
jgi:lactate dehydrogenase-like 2-hydroxyacid dehydrogenase